MSPSAGGPGQPCSLTLLSRKNVALRNCRFISDVRVAGWPGPNFNFMNTRNERRNFMEGYNKSLVWAQSRAIEWPEVYFRTPPGSPRERCQRHGELPSEHSQVDACLPVKAQGDSNSNSGQSEKNICRCSIKTWSPKSWCCLPGLIVC